MSKFRENFEKLCNGLCVGYTFEITDHIRSYLDLVDQYAQELSALNQDAFDSVDTYLTAQKFFYHCIKAYG